MSTQWKNEEQLNEAIRKLMHRIDCLSARSVETDIRSNAVGVEIQEMAFHNTVRDVFGADSQEYEDFRNTRMLRGPLRVGMSQGDVAQAKLRGREYMIQVCAQLIQRLQQKILELRQKQQSGTADPDALALHPVIAKAAAELIRDGHLWEAVFAAAKALVIHVKERSGRHDLDGVPLMRTVFSKNSPVLRFNSLANASELDEQEGMMHLYEGAVMALRNPGGHSFPDGPSHLARQYIDLLSLLAGRADEASR